MRRLIPILLFALMFTVAGSAGAVGFDLGLAAGAQFNGDIADLDLDTDEAFSLGLELMFEVPVVKLGVGYEYGLPRDTDGAVSDIEYHLVYGIARLKVAGPVYVMGRAGIADVSAKIPEYKGSDTALSWSVGVGVSITRFKFEAMYNDFDIQIDEVGGSMPYSNYAARVILSF